MQVERNFDRHPNKQTSDLEKYEDETPKSIKNSIGNIIKKEGYVNHKIFKRTISTEGGNYLGILIEIDVKGKTEEGEKETNIFVKQSITGEHMKFMIVSDCYNKESYFYNELLNIYEELQEGNNVPKEERYRAVNSFNECSTNAIILENLSKKGFKTLHRMDVLPLTFTKLAVKQLAKFHGLSMVMQKQNPEYFAMKLKTLAQPFIFNDKFDAYIKKMCDLTCKYLTEDSKVKVDKWCENFTERYKKVCDSSMPGCCVCHGDYRANNILYRELDGIIQEVVPIDFQLMHYGNPINDFLYLIFLGTDQEFRRKHMENLKNLYYETLERFLKFFNMDLEILFPREEFENRYKESLEYGLMISIYALPFMFTLESDVLDLQTTDVQDAEFNVYDSYKERIQGVVDDFIEWGCI